MSILGDGGAFPNLRRCAVCLRRQAVAKCAGAIRPLSDCVVAVIEGESDIARPRFWLRVTSPPPSRSLEAVGASCDFLRGFLCFVARHRDGNPWWRLRPNTEHHENRPSFFGLPRFAIVHGTNAFNATFKRLNLYLSFATSDMITRFAVVSLDSLLSRLIG